MWKSESEKRRNILPRNHSNAEQSSVLLPFQVLTNPSLRPKESIFPPRRRDEGNFAGQIHGDGKAERGLAAAARWLVRNPAGSRGSRVLVWGCFSSSSPSLFLTVASSSSAFQPLEHVSLEAVSKLPVNLSVV